MHLDNNPANDYYRNLKWGTQKENIKQCLSDGRLFKNEVFLSRQQKPDTIRDSVVKDYIKGFPLKYISNQYQVSISCITSILRERRIPRTRDTKFKIKE